MEMITSETEFKLLKTKDTVYLRCKVCKKEFGVPKRRVVYPSGSNEYCGNVCAAAGKFTSVQVMCKQCGKSFTKKRSEIKKSDNHYCGHHCAASFRNTHRTKGTRVSKLELYLQKELYKLYPTLKFNFNGRDVIGSELDIYIQSLSLAFELNGIFHYEPIYGEERLGKIQNNDSRKFQACLEHKIELCIIDSSSLKYFKPANAKKYLDMVTGIIDMKLNKSG